MTSINDLTAFIRTILRTTRLATENDDTTGKQLDEAAGILSTALAVTGMVATEPVDQAIDEPAQFVVPATVRGDLAEFFASLPKRTAVDDQAQPDAVLPTTREELAKFFGGIRLAASGAVVTGIFVQTALDVIEANGEDRPAPPTTSALHVQWADPAAGR